MKTVNQQDLLRKYAQRLAFEGLLKAILLSLTVGFAGVLVAAAVAWYKELNPLWLCLGILVGVTLVGTPIFYLAIFRPTIKENAKRIDRLGLEERTVTMLELEGEDNIISRLQREDARTHLARINEKMLKIRIPGKLLIWLASVASAACVMAVLATLAVLGIIMSGTEILAPYIPDPDVEFVYIEYIVDEGGYIEGEEFQEIVKGENGSEVMAVAEDGWIFIGWEDGNTRPERMETGVVMDVIMIAVFEPAGGNGEGEPGPGEGEPGEGEGGEGQPMDMPAQSGEPTDMEAEGNESQPQGAGGKYEQANQVVDGETYYRDVLPQYAELIEEYLASGEDIPEAIRKIIETYLDIIQ